MTIFWPDFEVKSDKKVIFSKIARKHPLALDRPQRAPGGLGDPQGGRGGRLGVWGWARTICAKIDNWSIIVYITTI